MKTIVLLAGLLFLYSYGVGQGISINDDGSAPDPSSMLDVKSNSKGFLIPRMTEVERDAISSPANGLLIYQTDANEGIYCNTGTTASPTWSKTVTINDQLWEKDNANHYVYPGHLTDRVGIGTTTPVASLHVADSAVVFTGEYHFPAVVEPPVSGPGTRMMWYPEKSAFRAGTLHSGTGDTMWNKDNIGRYSMALGTNVMASGQYSTAFGYVSTASGDYSTVSGRQVTAAGNNSFAIGNLTLAKAPNSSAFGRGTQANSYASMVLGYFNDTVVSEETFYAPTSPIFLIGNGQDINNRSNAMMVQFNGSAVFHGEYKATPEDPPVSGAGTRMMWYPDKAAFRAGYVASTRWDKANIGDYSVAIGHNPLSSGDKSVAIGSQPSATGDFSVSLGGTASGDYSFAALGGQAIGDFSMAFGGGSESTGNVAYAMGINLNAEAYLSFVVGRYNVGGGTASGWFDSEPLLEVGMGDSDVNRKNALTILKNGRHGIGIANPQARLHVADSAVLFTGTYTVTPADPPATGTGTRLMWYPDKAAFRAGWVADTRWDKSNVGDYSVAMGLSPMASGPYSAALGYDNDATGNCSFAHGAYNTASGGCAVSFGTFTQASGFYSTAMGEYTHAQAYGELVIGKYNVVAGSTDTWVDTDPVFVIGKGTSTVPANAFTVLKNGKTGINTGTPYEMLHVKGLSGETTRVRIEGNTNLAVLEFYDASTYGAGIGYSITNDNIFLYHNGNVIVKDGKLGVGTNTPQASIHVDDEPVLFSGTVTGSPADPPASGDGTRMMWYPDKASFRAGYVASTEWDKANIGNYSFAGGYSSKASATYSTALGYVSTASGTASTALGSSTDANGDYSLATGYNTDADGDYSSSYGYQTDANAYASLAMGRYNVNTGSTSSWVSSDPLLSVGNGTSISNRSNAFTVLKNGRTGINTASPAEELHVKGTNTRVRIEGTTNAVLEFFNGATYGAGCGYSFSNEYIFLYEDGTVMVQNGNLGVSKTSITAGRKIDVSGGAYCSGTTWVNNSDRNTKENISPVQHRSILNKIRELDISYWTYSFEENENLHIGPMAQDFHDAFNVGYDNTSISTVDADGVSFAAIKALAEENTELKDQVNELEKRLEKLESMMAAD